MKKTQTSNKLKLAKFNIAKLENKNVIKGGEGHVGVRNSKNCGNSNNY